MAQRSDRRGPNGKEIALNNYQDIHNNNPRRVVVPTINDEFSRARDLSNNLLDDFSIPIDSPPTLNIHPYIPQTASMMAPPEVRSSGSHQGHEGNKESYAYYPASPLDFGMSSRAHTSLGGLAESALLHPEVAPSCLESSKDAPSPTDVTAPTSPGVYNESPQLSDIFDVSPNFDISEIDTGPNDVWFPLFPLYNTAPDDQAAVAPSSAPPLLHQPVDLDASELYQYPESISDTESNDASISSLYPQDNLSPEPQAVVGTSLPQMSQDSKVPMSTSQRHKPTRNPKSPTRQHLLTSSMSRIAFMAKNHVQMVESETVVRRTISNIPFYLLSLTLYF